MEISLVFQEHPDEYVWEEYAFGRLGGAREAAVEEHLLVCQRCQGALARIEEFIRLMKYGTARFPENPPSRRFQPFSDSNRAAAIVYASATVACIAVALWVIPRDSSATPVPVALRSFRGGTGGTLNQTSVDHAPAKHPLDLAIPAADFPPASQYRLEVVSSAGKSIWSGPAALKDGTLSAHVPNELGAGLYWVRLYSQAELVAEFGLKLD